VENPAIARVLAEIGDLLEIKGENPFKIRAYRNAADTITHLAERVAAFTPRNGSASPESARTSPRRSASSSTPARAVSSRAAAGVPPTILDLLHLQGVGPKTVALLYPGLEIRTLDDLERAAREGRIRDLKGMGAKKEALILKALEERQRFTGRRLMPEAYDMSAALVAELRERAPEADISSVAAFDGDVRPAATSTSSRRALPRSSWTLHQLPLVERVLGRGETKSSVLLAGGFQADLRLVPRESLGAAQQYFTGSKRTTSRFAIARSSAG
jgi:DNA polymerase (family 10)